MTETRRRGAELENAILDAAWTEVVEGGYGRMTFEAVAARAGTSKPVLYRRWPTKDALLRATLAHHGIMQLAKIPDTGSLREDVIAALQNMNKSSGTMAGLLSSVLGSYFAETGVSIAQLRAMVFGDSQTGMQRIVARAIERGQLPPTGLPARVVALPSDLVRHELITRLEPVSDETIADIVDTVFMPLVETYTR